MKLERVVALSGGVGGGRFLDGLARELPSAALTAIVNTGDDFEHLGLYVCPDLDTVMYTLAAVGDELRGWGLAGETFAAMAMLRQYGGPDWFHLGDRDLATHLLRTAELRRGESLSAITTRLCGALGIAVRVLPMTDAPCRTLVETVDEGTLTFQDWLVRRGARPAVRGIRWDARPPPAEGVLEAIGAADLVLIAPSNPYVSIDPILGLDGVRAALAAKPVVAVSPIVHGRAVKGPLATMIPALAGVAPSAAAIARHYGALLRGIVVERGDERQIEGVAVYATDTVMRSRADRQRLARETLAFAAELLG
ncbi:MAG: 2-phospho-L-lactate transferase [Pseudomonadota bacterium]|nr:MAG: 2-phospho-L-lactate transferase [Pseudomonadota bacterium]